MLESKRLQQKPSLVALGGLAGSGKTEVANYLVSELGYKRVKFADPLKDMVRALLPSQEETGISKEEFIEGRFKEKPCMYLGGKTPRHVMQTLGTEWGRDLIDSDLWVDNAYRRINMLLNQNHSVVVDDVRFPNELIMLKRLGALDIWVSRGTDSYAGEHASEVSLSQSAFSVVLKNEGSLDDLKATARKLMIVNIDNYTVDWAWPHA